VVFGLNPGGWHHGASKSRRHHSARVSGLDPGDWHHGSLPGAVTTVPHGCPASIRSSCTTGHGRQEARRVGTRYAVDTPAERHRHRRRWQPSGGVKLKAQGSFKKSRPGYGPRQRRPVHGMFGGLGYIFILTHITRLFPIPKYH
jgi:hypothetical protein